jgi:hypothetical protein
MVGELFEDLVSSLDTLLVLFRFVMLLIIGSTVCESSEKTEIVTGL